MHSGTWVSAYIEYTSVYRGGAREGDTNRNALGLFDSCVPTVTDTSRPAYGSTDSYDALWLGLNRTVKIYMSYLSNSVSLRLGSAHILGSRARRHA